MTNQQIVYQIWNSSSGAMLGMAQYQKAFQEWKELLPGINFNHGNSYYLPLAWQLSLRMGHYSGDQRMLLITDEDLNLPLKQLIETFPSRIKAIVERNKTRLCTTLAAHHLEE